MSVGSRNHAGETETREGRGCACMLGACSVHAGAESTGGARRFDAPRIRGRGRVLAARAASTRHGATRRPSGGPHISPKPPETMIRRPGGRGAGAVRGAGTGGARRFHAPRVGGPRPRARGARAAALAARGSPHAVSQCARPDRQTDKDPRVRRLLRAHRHRLVRHDADQPWCGIWRHRVARWQSGSIKAAPGDARERQSSC